MLLVKPSQFEEINAYEAQPSIPDSSIASETPPKEEITRDEIIVQGDRVPRMLSETSSSHDSASGIMKIVPDGDVSHCSILYHTFATHTHSSIAKLDSPFDICRAMLIIGYCRRRT